MTQLRDIDIFWRECKRGWDIESRAWFEANFAERGYPDPVTMAVHHMHKRKLKDAAPVSAPAPQEDEPLREIHCDDYGHVWGAVIGEPGKRGERCNCGKAIWPSAPAATPAPTPGEVEMKYRTELWVNHGHDGIYGDDGEMQCSRCRPWDYKRAPLAEVEAAANQARMERIARSFPPAAPVAGTRPAQEE